MNKFLVTVFLSLIYIGVFGQQKPLPEFYVTQGPHNSNLISWVNNFGDDCIQLNIQRSSDSINGFRTVFSTPAPELPSNGFTDKTAPPGRVFYRIFYMLNGGSYYFTVSKQPALAQKIIANTVDTAKGFTTPTLTNSNKNNNYVKPLSVAINNFGNILITLPSDDIYRYSMEIWSNDDNAPIFTIKHFTDKVVVLDKSSFLKFGRYKYLLLDGDKKIEENYFNLSK
ncbi:hypothetical protein [Rhizosphaericola mali]|uniref:Uncharacterized protein n=1 Tax=Rhizosphaericola mali TaxID=2545455 RepID=A0A5P2G2E5_9BACT|nr:hypothetical protein [Rhizosphaericola mali]QES89357.1 hypothetical protein E0W69_012020 [Rhizosphaericola mali]